MLILLGSLSNASLAHQFYISITSIQHHSESQKLTIKVRLFINDLEEAIYQQKNVRLGLWKGKPIDDALLYIEQYIASNLWVSINGSPVVLNTIDQKMEAAEVLEDNVILWQFEAYEIPAIGTVKVKNTLLTDAIDAQVNIVKVRANGTRKSFNLNKWLPEDEVSFSS